MPKNIIEFNNITKSYHQQPVLNNINLVIPDHQIFVIVGPSGSGKTTLLKTINRLIKPESGQILFDQTPIDQIPLRQLRLKMGYVLQNIALFPNLTIYENIGIQLKALHKSKAERNKIAQRLMTASGIAPTQYGNRYPSELSGGEQQRIGIIRALAANPRLTLMDEPFSALDPIRRTQLQDLVLKLHHQFNNTVIFITHDMGEALKMGDTIAVLHNGQLIQVGAPEQLLQHPKNELVKQLFSQQHQQFVYNLIQAGDAQIDETPSANHEIDYQAPLSALAQALKLNGQVNVTFNHQTWLITAENLLDFISHQKDGTENE